MKSLAPSAFLLLEEGAAFAMLEGDDMSDTSNNAESHESSFPVEAWDAIAAGYDEHVTDGEVTIAETALRIAKVTKGERFLDVAAGTGGLSLPAARLGAKVIATDWSSKMIERFNARVRKERLADTEGKVMDCHALAFPDGTFDVTGSLFGVMLVPDQARALREMVRVTKHGGRVLLVAYGSPAQFEALHVFIAGLTSVVPDFPGLPSDPPPVDFQVADPNVLRERMIAAGLRDVTIDTSHREELSLRSGEALWNWCLGSHPIPNMLVQNLNGEQKAAMKKHIDGSLRDRPTLTAPLNIGVGIRP